MSVIEGALRRAGISLNPNAQVMVVDPSISGELQSAIDNAVGGNGDHIFVERGGHEVSATVNFDKSGMSVIAVDAGFAPLLRGEANAVFSAEGFTDGPAVKISAPCSVQGMGFASRDVGTMYFSGAACLIGGDADAMPIGAYLKNCRFMKWDMSNRIGLAIEGSTDVTIEDCSFEGVGTDFEAGIYIQGAMQNLHILWNKFRQCIAAVQVGEFAGGGPHLMMGHNVVEDGLIFDSQGKTGTGIIYDNWSEKSSATSYDAIVGTLNGQGWQFSGNHYGEGL
ncbi:MAG: right-handed parallel beta-helix repeat-containing protein [Actinomycetota bacterium]|nr:right-handed parallel beta-helix repeat-containing protein [Actinomycetota bacterium]